MPLLSRLGRKDARHQVVLSIFRGVFVDGATRDGEGPPVGPVGDGAVIAYQNAINKTNG